jgi:hypothetical protein
MTPRITQKITKIIQHITRRKSIETNGKSNNGNQQITTKVTHTSFSTSFFTLLNMKGCRIICSLGLRGVS